MEIDPAESPLSMRYYIFEMVLYEFDFIHSLQKLQKLCINNFTIKRLIMLKRVIILASYIEFIVDSKIKQYLMLYKES